MRRPWKPFRPSERALLQDNTGGQTTEDYADENNGPIYKDLDQLSDSDEADMDMSDSDHQSGEPTAKRARTTIKPDDGDSAPKWSNPDPYTALPPTEDADKKKKDMVQMIRKARVETSGARTSLPAPAADQDFLRFDSDSDEPLDDDEEFFDPLTNYRGPLSALGRDQFPGNVGNAQSHMLHPLPNKPGQAPSGPGQVAPQIGHQKPAKGTSSEQKNVIDLTQSPTQVVARRRGAPVDLTPSSDLGSRKRNHDDELILPAHAKLKPLQGSTPSGKLSNEWRAKAKESTCPWVQITTSQAHINIR